MKWMILGIVVGMLFIITSLIIYIYLNIKNKSQRRNVRKIGMRAEKQINGDIKTWSKKNNATFINDGLYRYMNNKVFEVDSILITEKALIVIEIKSIKGNIVGNANEDKWAKQLKNNSYSISNPIKQNDRHIQHITNIIKEKIPIISLIIFSDRTKELKITNIPSYALVIKHEDLFNMLNDINAGLPNSLTKKKRIEINKLIKGYRTNSFGSHRLHRKITGRID